MHFFNPNYALIHKLYSKTKIYPFNGEWGILAPNDNYPPVAKLYRIAGYRVYIQIDKLPFGVKNDTIQAETFRMSHIGNHSC